MKSQIKRIIWAPYAYLIDFCLFLLPFQMLMEDIFVHLELNNDHQVLDAGSGTGNICRFVWHKVNGQIKLTGVDFSLAMLKRAKKKCRAEVIHFEQADLNKSLPFPNNFFDAIFSCHVLYNLSDPHFTVAEFQRVLKPRGRLVIVTPQTNNPANVLAEHFSMIWRQSNWKCLAKTILLLPLIFCLGLYNLLLSWQSTKTKDHFFNENELKELLQAKGFASIRTKTAYANGDILACCQKEQEVKNASSGEN